VFYRSCLAGGFCGSGFSAAGRGLAFKYNFLFLRSWKYIPTAVSHPENPNKIDEYFRG